MTPAELLLVIENSGGHLESFDGRLRAVHVLPEFHVAVREHADALIALLFERAKPRPSGLLISPERLKAANERYLQELAQKVAPAPASGFVYRPRTVEQWQKRIDQSWQSNRTFRPPKPVVPKFEPDLEISEKKPKAKAVTENTPCTCSHTHGVHDTARPSYPPLKETFAVGDCSRITTPCKVNTGCDCWNFVDAETGKAAKLKRPPALPHVLCRKCGHARQEHCTAHKATKIRKPGEWEGFKRDGQAASCQHTTMEVFYRCSSTACAAAVGEEFCPCVKFVSPLTLPKVTPASRKKRATVCQGASPEVAATNSITEPVPAKPRRTRKKKTAFVTGTTELFPPGEASANP
jgi:hypothetical protein